MTHTVELQGYLCLDLEDFDSLVVMLLFCLALPFGFKDAVRGKTLGQNCDSIKGLTVAEPQEDENCPFSKLGSVSPPLSLPCPSLLQH